MQTSTARRIIFPERGHVAVESFTVPMPLASEVTVRTLYSLMSIGTETTILHGRYAPDSHFAARFSFPQRKTGVQAVAEVMACGPGVTDLQPGDRVFMRMAHTSHWTLPAAQCSPIPADVGLKDACWCGLARTAFQAANAAPFRLGGSVLIVGAGPVGQMAIRWASAAGMSSIVVVDLHPARLDHAARGGATVCSLRTISEQREDLRRLSGGQGFDLIVDATGSFTVLAQVLGVAARYGKVVLLGDSGFPDRQALTSAVMTEGLTIVATHDHHERDGWTPARVDRLFFQLVSLGRFTLDDLITHEFPPEECAAAYALADGHRDSTMGVLFDWT